MLLFALHTITLCCHKNPTQYRINGALRQLIQDAVIFHNNNNNKLNQVNQDLIFTCTVHPRLSEWAELNYFKDWQFRYAENSDNRGWPFDPFP